MIEGQSSKLAEDRKDEVNSRYASRLKTLHAHYLKALRKDRSLIHLGEVMGSGSETLPTPES